MRNKTQSRLWRVEWVYRTGKYRAPSRYVEAKTYNEAHRLVIEEKSRLGDFKDWSFYLNKLDLVQVNGKWITPAEEE